MKMNEIELNLYAESLFLRLDKAVLLKRAVISGGDWEPQEKMCHHNVSFWCDSDEKYKPVRGWLYFDLPDLEYVKFVAHSAVLTPENEIFDITPSSASQDYPFLPSGLSDEEFEKIAMSTEKGELNYVPKNA